MAMTLQHSLPLAVLIFVIAQFASSQNACATALTVCDKNGYCHNTTEMMQCAGEPIEDTCTIPGTTVKGSCEPVSPTLACYPQCLCTPQHTSASACGSKFGQPCFSGFFIGVYGDYSDKSCQCLLSIDRLGGICYAYEP